MTGINTSKKKKKMATSPDKHPTSKGGNHSNCHHNSSRRQFLKASAAGSAALAIGGLTKLAPAQPQQDPAEGAWKDGMQINPAIDNLRVVSLTDENMVTEIPTSWRNFSEVNEHLQRDVVHQNLDLMAEHLAQTSPPAKAWETIFQKPSDKDWNDVKAAFKVNNIEGFVQIGASPRATIALAKAARAHAFINQRGYVTPEDIKAIAFDVLRHRLIVTYEAEAENITSVEIIKRILSTVPVP